jgi:hypothetical protein
MTEILAPGVAMLDYDNDGDLDVYVVQGEMLGPGKTLSQARFPPEGPLPPKDRLYRNDLQVLPDGSRTLRFTDVTDASGIDSRGYGMGVAAADYDNDGWVDLYVTRFEANQMFRNNGDGTFSDVSARTGTDDASWSVSASFVDVDRDGWLDLFVGNYLRYTADTPKPCVSPSGMADYCAPAGYRPLPDRLYRNRGDGTFVEITAEARLRSTVIGADDQPRLRSSFGPALGVATADYNGDGWMDIYVANDGTENQLWINQRDGTFHDTALLAGVALSAEGDAEGSMGVDAGDFDNDGDEDLVMTEPRLGTRRTQPALHGVRHGVVRLRQRRLARSAHGQRHRPVRRRAGPGGRSVSLPPDETAVQESRQRPVRGRHRSRRHRLPALGGGPGSGVRRYRQRR